MFGAACSLDTGDMQEDDIRRMDATLLAFIDLLKQASFSSGLGPGKVPFIRPANCLAIINPEAIYLVIDDVQVGGMAAHTYRDRRSKEPVLSLDAVVGVAIQEFGFRQP